MRWLCVTRPKYLKRRRVSGVCKYRPKKETELANATKRKGVDPRRTLRPAGSYTRAVPAAPDQTNLRPTGKQKSMAIAVLTLRVVEGHLDLHPHALRQCLRMVTAGVSQREHKRAVFFARLQAC